MPAKLNYAANDALCERKEIEVSELPLIRELEVNMNRKKIVLGNPSAAAIDVRFDTHSQSLSEFEFFAKKPEAYVTLRYVIGSYFA